MDITQNCKECGKEFTVTEGERKWFVDRDMSVPLRCKACRKRRKAERAAQGPPLAQEKLREEGGSR